MQLHLYCCLLRVFILFFLLFFQTVVFAQHDFHVGGQLDFGMVGKTSFNQNTLKKKNWSPNIGGLAFVSLRSFDAMSIEVGIGQYWSNTRFKDPSFESNYDGFSVEMNQKSFFWNYYVALSGLLKINNSQNYLYGKITYSNNVYGGEQISNSKAFEISRLSVDQTISSNVSYSSSNESLIPEIGLEHKFNNSNLMSFGFRMNLGLSRALSGNYNITDNINEQTFTDIFSSKGNFVALNFRYSIHLHHIPKRERVKKIEIVPIDIENKPKKEKEEEKQEKEEEKEEDVDEIADRDLVVLKKVKVHSSVVTVFVWDHQTVDGDRISLNLNGKWILEDHTLTKEKYSFEIELEEGINTFVLHALNLGKYEPNTAAFIVKEGTKSHRIILESDMNESGTLQINYKR